MEERPKIKLDLTITHKMFDLVAWFLIVAIWIMTITNYSSLPDIIPTHYNGAGKADGYGGKVTILTLPLIATILFLGLTVLSRFPHTFNYPITITKENALRQYTTASKLISYLKLIIVILFGLISFKTIQSANGKADGLGIWFLPLTLGMIFIPLTYYVINSLRHKE